MGEPYQSTHIYHVTDTFDYRAQGKIDAAYTAHKGRLGIRDAGYTFTPGINSIDIGISASEFLTNTQRPDQIILALNYAPPDPDKKAGATNNHRKDFFCAVLAHSSAVQAEDVACGTVNGSEFSYIKSEITQFYRLTNTNRLNSQFRSLEILPECALLFSDPQKRRNLIQSGILEEVKNLDVIADPHDVTHVHEVDNFQNVKLFPSLQDLLLLRENQGKKVSFSFHDASLEATSVKRPSSIAYQALVTDALFKVPVSQNGITLRSSSQTFARGEVETAVPMIATVRGNPAETPASYRPPKVGAAVQLLALAS